MSESLTSPMTRSERQAASQARRAAAAVPNRLQGMSLADRQFEREKRRARMPRARDQRLQAKQDQPKPIREQVADLQAEVAQLAETKGKKG